MTENRFSKMTFSLGSVLILFLLLPVSAKAGFEDAAQLYRQKEYVSAFSAFTELATLGNPKAQTALALMYRYGEGTKANLTSAFRWYQLAAKQGYAPAQFHTGNFYAEGIATEINQEKALYWLNKAAQQGFNRASDRIDVLDAEWNRDVQKTKSPQAWSTKWDFHVPNTDRFGTLESNRPLTTNQYSVQIGAMKSMESANTLWVKLKDTHAELFASLQPQISLSDNTGKPSYRIRTGSFANYDKARKFCEKLLVKTIQADCMIINSKQ